MSTYSQDGVLGDVEPGKRVRDAIDRLRSRSDSAPDMSQAASMVPDNPGPSVMGRTTVIGQARRDRDIPVLRDQVPELLD